MISKWTIVRAAEESLPAINALIVRSKSYWPWPAEYLKRALVLHKIDPAYLHRSDAFSVLESGSALVGFFAVVTDDQGLMLDNLWVSPERIGQGIGRQACDFAFRLAKERGHPAIRVVPDPPAEGFYVRIGFVDTRERVQSRAPGGPLFSVFRRGIT